MINRKIAAIIQARIGSTRLPKKAMLKVLNKPLLHYMIGQVKKSKKINDIIIVTSIKKENSVIRNFCKKNGIKCFSGSDKNLVNRYYLAAKKFNIDIIVRLTSDCPLIDSHIIDKLIEKYTSSKYDFVANTSPPYNLTYPDGMDVEIFSSKILKFVNSKCKIKTDLEHVTPYIWRKKKKFKQFKQNLKKNLSHLRLTVDYSEDFELIRNIIIYFKKNKININLNNIRKYLASNPDVYLINKKRNKNFKLNHEH